MTNSKYSDFNHSFTRSRGAIRRYLRTSGTTKHIKNPYRYQTLEYVSHQLEFGFNPKWFFTFHYFTTEELFRLLRESKELYGFKERYGLGKEWYYVSSNLNFKEVSINSNGKSRWLIQEVERNGGANDLSLAIQLIITNNQKAFLRSWSLVS